MELQSELPECKDIEHQALQVSVVPDPFPLLRAPLTEISFMTLKPSLDSKGLRDLMSIVLERSSTTLRIQHGTSWGKTNQDDKLFTLLMGWNSLEVCG